MRKIQRSVLVLLFVIISISCAPRYTVKDLSLEELLEALEKSGKGTMSLKGFISAEFKGDTLYSNSKGTIEGILLFRAPNSLRFQGLNPLGLSILDLSMKDDKFQLFLPEANQVITGKSDSINAMPLLSIRPGELLDIFRYPLMDRDKKVFSFEKVEDGYMLYQSDQKRPASIEKKTLIDRKTLLIKREYIYNEDGSINIEILHDNYQRVDRVMIPHSISVNKPKEQLTLRLIFKKIIVNPVIKDEEFAITAGEGAEVIEMNERP